MDIVTQIEGLLYLLGDDGLEKERILELCKVAQAPSDGVMQQLQERYTNNPSSALQIQQFGTQYKMTTKSEHATFYEQYFSKISIQQLSNAALEVLAIIAYNQPITRARIEKVRGVNSDSVLRKLQMFNLIEEQGREDSPGLPVLFGVSQNFLDYFGLLSLEELPQLKSSTVEEISDDIDIFMTKYQEVTQHNKEVAD